MCFIRYHRPVLVVLLMATKSEGIADRIVSDRRRIGDEALLRYGLATFHVDSRAELAADRFIDALAATLETGDTSEVVRWAISERADTAPLPLRELAHATCMTIGAEVAHSFRGSFREIMGVLRRVETDLASALRGTSTALEAVAA